MELYSQLSSKRVIALDERAGTFPIFPKNYLSFCLDALLALFYQQNQKGFDWKSERKNTLNFSLLFHFFRFIQINVLIDLLN